MQRIFPNVFPTFLMRDGICHKDHAMSELGIYGAYLRYMCFAFIQCKAPPPPTGQPWRFTCLFLSITSMNPFWQLVFLTPFSFNIPSKHYKRHIRPSFLICEALDNLGMECAGTRTRWSWMTNAVTCCGQRLLHQMKVVLQPDLRYWTVYIWLDGGSLDVTQINSKNSSLISTLYMLNKISWSRYSAMLRSNWMLPLFFSQGKMIDVGDFLAFYLTLGAQL